MNRIETPNIQDIKSRMVNYVFRNDPVPRFYGWKGLITALQDGLRYLDNVARVLSGRVGAAIVKALVAALSFWSPLVAELIVSAGNLMTARTILDTKTKLQEWLDPLLAQMDSFQHFAPILFVRKVSDSSSAREWLRRFRACDAVISDHNISNYVRGIEKQGEEFTIEYAEDSCPEACVTHASIQICYGAHFKEL